MGDGGVFFWVVGVLGGFLDTTMKTVLEEGSRYFNLQRQLIICTIKNIHMRKFMIHFIAF